MIIEKTNLADGSIHPPENLAVLKQTFKDFDNILVDIDHILSPTTHILNDLLPVLEFPSDLNQAINELEEVIISVEAATAILIAIPIVGEVIAGIDEAIDDVIEVVNDAKTAILNPVIDFCNPIKDAIKKIEKPLQKIDSSVVSLQASITKWGAALDVIQEALALAAGIGNAFDAAGQEAVGKVFEKLVDAYNTVVDEINKPLKVINTAMEDIDKVLKPIGDAMSKLKTGTFDKVGNAAKTVDKILTTFNPLHEILSHIQSVLKPFEWVLDKAGKIINKVLGPVLKPLLKPLENKIAGIIGFPPDFQTTIQAAISNTSDSQTTQNGSTTVVSGQSAVGNNQGNLETAMENFVSGDINQICDNLLKIIQKNSNR